MANITVLEALQLSLNATKKYVDDKIAETSSGGGEELLVVTSSATTFDVARTDIDNAITTMPALIYFDPTNDIRYTADNTIIHVRGLCHIYIDPDGMTNYVFLNSNIAIKFDSDNYSYVRTLYTPKANILSKYNTIEYIPTADYHPATKLYVDEKVAGIVDSAPETLDTLKELSTALGNDPNFATTITNQIGTKVDKVDGKSLVLDTEIAKIHEHSNKDLLDTIEADNVHAHSNKSVIDAITSDMTTNWNKSIPFENTYVSDCDTWLTNGYTKTSTETTNHPSVCTGADKWGVLFYISENATNGTGTQMYFPIDGTYAGRVFTRKIVNRSAGAWNLVSTFDGNYDSLTNKPTIPTVVTSANGITIADTAGNFTATNVEGALAELFQFVSNGKTLIASAITDMGVATSNTDSFETMANKIKTIIGGTAEQPLYKFGLLSDVHVDGDDRDEAYSISDLNNAISFLQNAGANFIAYTGDMTYNGRTEDYTALKTCLETSTIPNYCVRGNHDAYSLSDGYASATGCKDDYIITQNNDLLIFISCADTNHDTGGLTTSKLDWLENLLQTNTNTRVFLFYHYFVDGTSGNAGGNYPWGSLNPSNAIALRFINMVKQYPNLIYCNGHSHIRFNLQDQYPNANYYHNNGECYYIHVPSGAKPRYLSGDTVADYYEGSEGYLVEVYADKVIFKPIDFISSEYLTKYNYTANVSQGNNVPTVPSEPSDPSAPTITWNDGIKIDKTTGAESSSDARYSASDFIAYDSSKTYTLNYRGTVTNNTNAFICYYDSAQSFISCGSEYVGTYKLSAAVPSVQLPVVDNAKYIKLRYYSDNNASDNDKSIITLTTTNPTSSLEVITPTWETGNITSAGVDNNNDRTAIRTNHINFDTNAYTYKLTTSSDCNRISDMRFYYFNDDGTYNSRTSFTELGITAGMTIEIPFPTTTGTFRLKAVTGTVTTLENMNNVLIVTKVAK